MFFANIIVLFQFLRSRGVKTPKKDEGSSVDFSDNSTMTQYDMGKVEREYSKLKNKAKYGL